MFDDQRKTAFEFARDTTTQLITLSTGVVALGITFRSDFLGEASQLASLPVRWIGGSWICFFASILFGCWTLCALTGTLESTQSETAKPTIRGLNVTIPSLLQILFFLAGMVLTTAFGWRSLEL